MNKATFVRSLVLCLMIPALLAGLVLEVRQIHAQNTVYIRADGSIEPVTAPILTLDNVTYTLAGNLTESIVIERSNIVFEGSGYSVNGLGGARGLDLNNVENITIREIRIEGFYYGLYLNLCTQITVTESNITMNAYDGVNVVESSNSNFSRNRISDNGNDGLKMLNSSSNNIIAENTIILNNDDGIQLSDSPQNTILGNNVSQNSDVGIYAFNSSATSVVGGNTVANNREGLVLTSSLSNEVKGNTFNNNTLRGISLSLSSDTIFEGNEVKGNYDGLYASQSPGNVFFENDVQGNSEFGVWLDFSSNSTLIFNNITGNTEVGAYVRYSSGSFISDNNISNSDSGISLSGSANSSILGNLLANNYNGMDLAFGSTNNQIHHNNFVNNTLQASSTSAATWEDGLEGNYWSDYSGFDVDMDGLGDSPYVIGVGNDDDLPLMGMFHRFNTSLGQFVNVISNSTIDDFNYVRLPGDITIVMHVSNMTSSQTAGLCRVAIPHSLMTEPYNVTINGAQPNHVNYTVYDNATHRWMYFNYNHSTLEVMIQGIETTPPDISVISPENMTYTTSDVPLVFTVDEPTSWMGYSLDGEANVTIDGNTTLMDLSEGMHGIIVFANDTFGNMEVSDVVYFSADTLPPTVQVLSPENITYQTDLVMLTFDVSEPVSWMGYDLDGEANVTVVGNTTLSGLPDGLHSIVVYANDSAGNMGASNMIGFTVARAPTVFVLSPQNMTYAISDVELTVTIDEIAYWMGYSLDGQANVTILGNTTLLGLSDGVHDVLVYANDTSGNMASSNKVYFSVDTTVPAITILSPLNQTYQTGSIALTFTVSKPTSWIGYSLDSQANVTIAGNTTLLGLLDGYHSIVVYAADDFGITGSSVLVYFSIDTAPPTISILSPLNQTYQTSSITLVFTVDTPSSWIGYSIDGQANVTALGNTTLLGLPDGAHDILVYANDTSGNMAFSNTVHFSVDATTPDIANVTQNPPEDGVLPYDSVSVNATVTDSFSGISKVFLNYTTNNATWFDVEMFHLEGNIWNATIPGFPYCTTVRYVIIAEDNAGNSITSEELAYTLQYHVVPEFLSYIALLLLMAATLVALALHRSKMTRA